MRRRATLAATFALAMSVTARAAAPATAPTADATPQAATLSPPAASSGPTFASVELFDLSPSKSTLAGRATSPPATTPATSPPAAIPGADLSWTLPAGWRDIGRRLTQLGEPAHRLAAATFDLRQREPDGNCSPATARAQLPPHGALVFLLESRDWEGRRPRLRPRPARFQLPAAAAHKCFGRARLLSWGEHDRSLTAVVLLGRRAGAARRAQAEALLDSLVVQPVPPPPPPAGWRAAISAADSLRVPPGWSAYALKRQRGVARPRVLFRVANAHVVLRVVEHRRGPASPAFPPVAQPLVFDARRRAGISFRGYRVSLRIFPRPGATAQDLAWAELSARSLGVSSVGRG